VISEISVHGLSAPLFLDFHEAEDHGREPVMGHKSSSLMVDRKQKDAEEGAGAIHIFLGHTPVTKVF
jgi:hypothetical protein